MWTRLSPRTNRTNRKISTSRTRKTGGKEMKTVEAPLVCKLSESPFRILSVCSPFMDMSHAMRQCVFGSLRPGKTQTDLLSYRDQLESWNFGYINWRHHSVLAANNKGADQTARMRRLICAFVVRIWHKTHFLMAWLIFFFNPSALDTILKISCVCTSTRAFFYHYFVSAL